MNNQNVKLLAKTIRVLSAEGVEKANSGHPGMPMGAADLAAVLWSEFLKFNPQDLNWFGRDKFVLSAGHGSMLLYSLLHLFQYDLSMSELKSFRQWDSKTPGHPEFGLTSGVEVTTGPLGQGFANGVGLALSSKMLEAKYGTSLLNSRVFGIVSDGDLMEGISTEAASLAGHWKLDNLVYLYDDNEISIGGSTDICFTENIPQKFTAMGWYVQSIDGHNIDEIRSALKNATDHKGQPALICAKTSIGFGSPNKVNTADVHGSPLGKEELELSKKQLGWEHQEEFFIPSEVQSFCETIVLENQKQYKAWQNEFSSWKENNKQKYSQFLVQQEKAVAQKLQEELYAELEKIEKDATRNISGVALQIIAKHLPGLIGGSADLEPSTKTLIKGGGDVSSEDFSKRNIRYGVREHTMGAISNGLAYTNMWFPYTATFLVFSDYMRPSIRLSALSHLQNLFIFTHDSFFVGEDGPTHQPIEHIQALRIIPNLDVYRPADGLEVASSYFQALNRKNKSAALLLTRQNLPRLQREPGFKKEDLLKGGYVVTGSENSEITLVATGSEVALAVEAKEKLAKEKNIQARVVSIPCVEIFMEQPKEYRELVIPTKSKKVLLEAGVSSGWERVAGNDAVFITKEDYGASAPANILAEKFGFTAVSVFEKILKVLRS